MKWLTHWTTALLTLTLILFLHYDNGFIVDTLRLKQFDLLQQSDPVRQSEDIGIVTIDEKAIEKYGQWPWNRETLSNLVWQLRKDGAGVIVIPVLFSETDRLGGDDILSQTLQNNGVVIAQTGTQKDNQNAVPRGIAKIGNPVPYLYEWQGVLGPIPELGDAASGVGVINTVPERDGVVRRVPLLMRVGDEVFPSLGIEVIRVATGQPSYQVKESGAGIEAIRVPGFPIINTDPNGRIWLRWNKEFPTISAAENNFSDFEGKTVIIGAQAAGLGGIIASPTGPKYNYEPAAVTLQTLIDGEQIERPYWAFQAELATTLGLGLAIVALGRFTPYWVVGVGILALGGSLVYSVNYAWTNHLYLLDGTMPLVALVLVGLHSVFLRFVKEFREKQAIKKQFSGYASPQVVKLLQTQPELIKQGTKKKITTVMSDLRGFTPLSESFGDDVQGLTQMMNAYMDAISTPILDSDAMIIKYIGDATMHIHNAPIDDDMHATNSVKTALNMLEAVDKFNAYLIEQNRPEIGMGIGINTGYAYAGEIGSKKRHSYDVLGDSVNTAARLEGQSKPYGVRIVVGGETARLTERQFFHIQLDKLAVKGKTKPLKIYTVIDYKSNIPEEFYHLRDKHNRMLEMYRIKNFDEAISLCKELHGSFDGKMNSYYDMWIERCEFMQLQNLPDDWDGTFSATSK
jgi:adenylate cyclase